MNFTLTQEQYESLISLAAKGTLNSDGSVNQENARTLDAWLRLIEQANNITRSILWVQWQEAGQPLPPTVQFPETWPPEMRYKLELITRPIGLADVQAVIAQKARKAVNVLVTPDPGAQLGWTPLDSYFKQ